MRPFLLCLAVILAAGCAKESSLPTASGKGRVQAINAIPGSPGIEFRIEERVLGTLSYKSASGGARYDDFEYDFNFDAVLDPVDGRTRIASVTQKVDADRYYTFVLTGDVAAPEILVWEGDERSFDAGATVFQAEFAHLAESQGELDVYLLPESESPVAGSAIGTVAYGEILPPVDLTAERRRLTLTASGDPSNVVFRSTVVAYSAATAYTLTLFDGDEADVAPLTVRLITQSSGGALTDARYDATIRLFHAASSMPATDVYDNEALTSLVIANQAFGEVSADLPLGSAEIGLTWTAAGNPGAILLEDTVDATAGTHNNLIVIEDLDEATDETLTTRFYSPDRRSVSTFGKVGLFHAAADQESVDIYAVNAEQPITEVLPRFRINYGTPSDPLVLQEGSFDLYATKPGEKTPVAGPTRIDLENGDVVEVLLLDTADPNVAAFSPVPAP